MQCVASSSQPVISGDQFWNRRARERDGETVTIIITIKQVAWQPANIQIKQPQFVSTDIKAIWKQASAFTLFYCFHPSCPRFCPCLVSLDFASDFGANVSVFQCSVRIFTYPHQFSVYFRKFEIYMLVFTPLVALILNKDNIISLGTLHMTTKSRAVHPHRLIIS